MDRAPVFEAGNMGSIPIVRSKNLALVIGVKYDKLITTCGLSPIGRGRNLKSFKVWIRIPESVPEYRACG